MFGKRHALLVVIHTTGLEQASRNVRVARDAGADGVFLINHSISADALVSIHQAVAAQHPTFWIGMNVLGVDDAQLLECMLPGVAGLWKNDAGVRDGNRIEPEGLGFAARLAERRSRPLYFGGVAFKYQAMLDDPQAAARSAMPLMDVITTSGSATGSAPEVDKVRRMKSAIGDHSLAVASGVSIDNVEGLLPHVDCFLVATSISRSFDELDPDKTRALARAIG